MRRNEVSGWEVEGGERIGGGGPGVPSIFDFLMCKERRLLVGAVGRRPGVVDRVKGVTVKGGRGGRRLRGGRRKVKGSDGVGGERVVAGVEGDGGGDEGECVGTAYGHGMMVVAARRDDGGGGGGERRAVGKRRSRRLRGHGTEEEGIDAEQDGDGVVEGADDGRDCDREGSGSRLYADPAFSTAAPCALVELY